MNERPTLISKKKCPYCKIEHRVFYEGTKMLQLMNGHRLNVYRCMSVGRAFTIEE